MDWVIRFRLLRLSAEKARRPMPSRQRKASEKRSRRETNMSSNMKSGLKRAVWGCLMSTAILTGGTAGFSAPSSPSTQLAWETDFKRMVPKENDMTAEFTFGLTNISDSEVVIDHVTATCSCTVAKLPSQP